MQPPGPLAVRRELLPSTVLAGPVMWRNRDKTCLTKCLIYLQKLKGSLPTTRLLRPVSVSMTPAPTDLNPNAKTPSRGMGKFTELPTGSDRSAAVQARHRQGGRDNHPSAVTASRPPTTAAWSSRPEQPDKAQTGRAVAVEASRSRTAKRAALPPAQRQYLPRSSTTRT